MMMTASLLLQHLLLGIPVLLLVLSTSNAQNINFPPGCSLNLSPSCYVDNSPGLCIGFASESSPCKPRFFCPNSSVTDTASVPRICPPSIECQLQRMTARACSPQGEFEPSVCPSGYYCPTYDQRLFCPEGKHCPIGTIEPRDCGPLSSCPKGSVKRVYYGGIIGFAVIDVFLLIAAFFKLWHDRLQANRHIHGADNVNATQVLHQVLYDVTIGPFASLYHLLSPKQVRRQPISDNGEKVNTNKDGKVAEMEEAIAVPSNPVSAQENIKEDYSRFISFFKKALNGMDMQMDFNFSNLGLQLPNGKVILNGVTGEIKSGKVTAIMGPSGAGKTTFMHTLMGKVNRTAGQLFICGKEAEMSTYKKVIGYVPQEDIMHRELTVRENILHSARIRLPNSWKSHEIEDYVDTILDILSLKEVAHQRIGDELTRGVSGGQRKRVNIGMELASCPLVLCLDEPTSGLDSTAALNVALLLRRIANLGITVMAVIHQPRYEIFEVLDDLLMIAPGGRTAYLGTAQECVEYFKQMGYEFKAAANPADVLMDILSGKHKNDIKEYTPDELVAFWKKHETANVTEETTSSIVLAKHHLDFHKNIGGVITVRGASFVKQFIYCHNRAINQAYATINSFWLEIGVGCLAGAMMGLANLQTAGELYRGVLVEPYTLISPAPIEWLVPLISLFVGLAISIAGAPAGASLFGKERHIYYREAAAGHNRVAYYLAKTISSFYRFALSALHFASLYYVLSCPITNFSTFYLICFGFFYCVYGLANLVAMFVKPENASLMSCIACMTFAVLCGSGPNLKNASNWGVKWLWDLSYARWFSEAFVSSELEPFEGVYQIDEITVVNYGYTLRRVGLDLGIGFIIGTVFRIVGYLLLTMLNRSKQR